jgi:hypothetical protein
MDFINSFISSRELSAPMALRNITTMNIQNFVEGDKTFLVGFNGKVSRLLMSRSNRPRSRIEHA